MVDTTFEVDEDGRLTSASVITYTLPSDNNTDTKVRQYTSAMTSSYPILYSYNSSYTTTTYEAAYARKNSGFKYDAANNALIVSKVSADLTGNADTATKFNSNRTIKLSGKVTGEVSSDGASG